jgi:hypothetical protein
MPMADFHFSNGCRFIGSQCEKWISSWHEPLLDPVPAGIRSGPESMFHHTAREYHPMILEDFPEVLFSRIRFGRSPE